MTGRLALALALGALAGVPAAGWEAASDETCRIEASLAEAEVTVAYYPLQGLYAILIRNRTGDWPEAGWFSIRFDGADPNTISTDRQFHPDGDPAVIAVIDSGFGNVLNGLAAGGTAYLAFDGQERMGLPLDGAAPAVAAFEACVSRTPT